MREEKSKISGIFKNLNINNENDKKESIKKTIYNNFNSFRKKAIIKENDINIDNCNGQKKKEKENENEKNKNNKNIEVKAVKNNPLGNLSLLISSYNGNIYDYDIYKLTIKDSNLNLIQAINTVLKNNILDISIKDKNSFVILSSDEKIEIWSKENKENNIFKLFETFKCPFLSKNLKAFEGIIKYLKNETIIISCFNSIMIYNKIKSIKKHQLLTKIKAYYPIFNIRKDLLVFFNTNYDTTKFKYSFYYGINLEDDKNNFSKILFYKLKNNKLIKKVKYDFDAPNRFDFLDDNRIVIPLSQKIIIFNFFKNKAIKLKINNDFIFSGNLLVNENKKIFFVEYRDTFIFNSNNYQIINIIKFSFLIYKFIPISQEEIGIISENIQKII